MHCFNALGFCPAKKNILKYAFPNTTKNKVDEDHSEHIPVKYIASENHM